MKRCFLLLVDGLRPDVAERELAAGRLPHLADMVREGGTSRAVTVFPSTTSVAYLPFLTGCTPGRCNIPSIRWLDRAAYAGRWWQDRESMRSYCGYQTGRLDGDIDPTVRTIFELVPESMAIFTMISRGLTAERDPAQGARRFWGAVAHYAQWHQPSDGAVAKHLFRAVEEPWRFVFAQFPAVDGYTHQSTPEGPKVLRALRAFDDTIGRLRARLRERGELDDSLIILVSDHGAAPVHTHLDLADWFRVQGVPTVSHPVLWERAPRAAVMVAGNCSAAVYARPGTVRPERWTLEALRRPEAFGAGHDVVAALIDEPAVAFVAAEDAGGGVRVASVAGEAVVERPATDRIRYRPISGDPLGIGGAWEAPDRDWLDATADGRYPDAPYQLLDQFRSARGGDLVVIAKAGYDFRKRFEVPEHKAGHGSLIREHMLTPVWASEPLPPGLLRTADVFPAMLEWLGVDVPEGIDGEAVWSPGAEPAPREA